MKKLISIALSLTIAVSVAMSAYMIPSYAIGYNKVVDNEFGGKTTYVATEYLDDYVQELEDEMNEAKNKYMDKYHIHPWKGFLYEMFPIILAIAFNISLNFAVKIFNYIRLKKSLNANPQAPMPAEGLWEKSSLSFLQTMFLGVVSGATLFYGLVKSKNYSALPQLIEADDIWSKNDWILYNLKDPDHPDFVESIRLYGAEIECHPMSFADKINKQCHVNSQERFFIKGCKRYDPDLADTIPKLNYIPR